jgi:hypothetical protein
VPAEELVFGYRAGRDAAARARQGTVAAVQVPG